MKVLTIVGTRPELIKLSATIPALDDAFEHLLVHSGQNFDFELGEIFYADMGIRRPDRFLNCARETPTQSIAEILIRTEEVIGQVHPDAFLIYGDTNSCLSAIVAKRRKVPVFHMEAGNRCFDERVPEEINRRLLDHISDINMPLTEHGRRYLVAEGIRPDTIIKIGSPIPEVIERQSDRIEKSEVHSRLGLQPRGYFVVSLHREENVDDVSRLKNAVDSLREMELRYSLPIVLSLHPRMKKRMLDSALRFPESVIAMPPLSFSDYIALQKSALCVVSDSGTITEESSVVGFPAVTPRYAHERPEGMDEGTLVMANLEPQSILSAIGIATTRAQRTSLPDSRVSDYDLTAVSEKVVRIIASYTDAVNRNVWRR